MKLYQDSEAKKLHKVLEIQVLNSYCPQSFEVIKNSIICTTIYSATVKF